MKQGNWDERVHWVKSPARSRKRHYSEKMTISSHMPHGYAGAGPTHTQAIKFSSREEHIEPGNIEQTMLTGKRVSPT